MKVGAETQTQPHPQASPAQCPAAQGLPASPPFLPQGTVLCDIILLNFLKGADQYKAKKFEEVSGPRKGIETGQGGLLGPRHSQRPQGLTFQGLLKGSSLGLSAHWGSPPEGVWLRVGSVRTLGVL